MTIDPVTPSPDRQPLLKASHLSHSPGTLALVRDVSLEIYPGEVVGLAGQSGAGKTALALILAGVCLPQAGELYFAGQRLTWPFRARNLGIEVIHGQPEMAEAMDVTRNVFLGSEIGWSPFGRWLKVPDLRRMDAEANAYIVTAGRALRFAARLRGRPLGRAAPACGHRAGDDPPCPARHHR